MDSSNVEAATANLMTRVETLVAGFTESMIALDSNEDLKNVGTSIKNKIKEICKDIDDYAEKIVSEVKNTSF